jgi:hypothetical protein
MTKAHHSPEQPQQPVVDASEETRHDWVSKRYCPPRADNYLRQQQGSRFNERRRLKGVRERGTVASSEVRWAKRNNKRMSVCESVMSEWDKRRC